MSTSEGFVEFLKEHHARARSRQRAPHVRRRRDYADGVMFGLIADYTLYLKADEKTRRDFEAEGLGPFVYEGGGRTIAMSYWRIPERLLDDPDEMAAWARTALGVAQRAAAAKPKCFKPGTIAHKGKKGT